MDPWILLLTMSLATFILSKLVVDLDFPPVLWVRDRVVGGFRPLTLAEQAKLNNPRAQREVAEWDIQLINGEDHLWKTRSKRVPLFFAELMSCPWCVSAWASAGVVVGAWATVGIPVPALMWLAVWALGALLAQHEWD